MQEILNYEMKTYKTNLNPNWFYLSAHLCLAFQAEGLFCFCFLCGRGGGSSSFQAGWLLLLRSVPVSQLQMEVCSFTKSFKQMNRAASIAASYSGLRVFLFVFLRFPSRFSSLILRCLPNGLKALLLWFFFAVSPQTFLMTSYYANGSLMLFEGSRRHSYLWL